MNFSTRKFTSNGVRGNNVDFSTIKITLKKVCGNNVDFSTIAITSKKVRRKNVNFSTMKIASKKLRGNNVDCSTSKITLKKVSGNNVDFSTIKNTLKKNAEMTRKIAEIWSLTCRLNIHVESTWIQHSVPVGLLFKKNIRLRMHNFQGLNFIWIRTYGEIFKPALVRL